MAKLIQVVLKLQVKLLRLMQVGHYCVYALNLSAVCIVVH